MKNDTKLITFENYLFIDMIEVVRDLEGIRKQGKLDAIIFEPHEDFEQYIRNNLYNREGRELDKTGHSMLILNYANAKNLPVFCISRKNIDKDLDFILDEVITKKYKNLTTVISNKNKELFLPRLVEKGLLSLNKK